MISFQTGSKNTEFVWRNGPIQRFSSVALRSRYCRCRPSLHVLVVTTWNMASVYTPQHISTPSHNLLICELVNVVIFLHSIPLSLLQLIISQIMDPIGIINSLCPPTTITEKKINLAGQQRV